MFIIYIQPFVLARCEWHNRRDIIYTFITETLRINTYKTHYAIHCIAIYPADIWTTGPWLVTSIFNTTVDQFLSKINKHCISSYGNFRKFSHLIKLAGRTVSLRNVENLHFVLWSGRVFRQFVRRDLFISHWLDLKELCPCVFDKERNLLKKVTILPQLLQAIFSHFGVVC